MENNGKIGFGKVTLPAVLGIEKNYAQNLERDPFLQYLKTKTTIVGGPGMGRFAQEYITWVAAPFIPCLLWTLTHNAGTYLDYRTVIVIELVKSHHNTMSLVRSFTKYQYHYT